jgi:glutathione S-transferase
MEKIEIIGHVGTYTRAVRMACEEKQIAYSVVEALPRSPEVQALHPFGKVPVLRHGGFVLCESKAIVTYLDRVFPATPLIPADLQRAALTEQWISLVNSVIDRTMVRDYVLSYVFPKGPNGTPDRQLIESTLPAIAQQMLVLDRAVSETGYLVGSELTFADLNLLPILASVWSYPEGREAIGRVSALRRYLMRHAERPSFGKTGAALAA